MRSLAIYILLNLSFIPAFSQDTILPVELEHLKNFTISNFPLQKFDPAASDAIVFVEENEESLLFTLKHNNEISCYFKLAHFTVEQMGVPFINTAKIMQEFTLEGDTLSFCYEMPFRATLVCLYFHLNDTSVQFLSSDVNDPSEETIALAEEALKNGEIENAVNYYSGVMYPTSYFNEDDVSAEIMMRGHELAMKEYTNNSFKNAVQFLHQALSFYGNTIYLDIKDSLQLAEITGNKSQKQWNLSNFKLWVGDYGLMLYKSGDLDGSAIINDYLNKILPLWAEPYLQTGDTYYAKKDFKRSKLAYKKYIQLRTAEGNKKSIPKRAYDRSK